MIQLWYRYYTWLLFCYYKALIFHNGTVNLVYSAVNLNTRCTIDIFLFPFGNLFRILLANRQEFSTLNSDKQVCTLEIGSWTLSQDQFDFTTAFCEIRLENFVDNAVWDLTNFKTTSEPIRDRFSFVYGDYLMRSASLILYLTRKPLYFIGNAIIPSIVLNIANLVLFALPNG